MATDVTEPIDASTAEVDEDDDLRAGLERFREWVHSDLYPEHGKFAYVQGVLEAEMSPESYPNHGSVKIELTVALHNLIRSLQLGVTFPDGTMFVNEAVALATEPDLMFCSWDTMTTERAMLRPYRDASKGLVELHGVPDLVVEIVSPSSVKKDKVRLKKAYFECGISEYWLIDARKAELDFKLFVRGEKEYVPSSPDADGYLPSALLKHAFRIERQPNPLIGFEYRVHTRTNGQA